MKIIEMKKLLVFLIFCLLGCSSNKSLRYRIKNKEVNILLQNEIEQFKKYTNKEIVLELGREKGFNRIVLRPMNKNNKEYYKIQNLPINKTNRYILINKQKYFVVFDYDYRYGVVEDYIIENGIKETIYRKEVYINELSKYLYFDDDWNLIKEANNLLNANFVPDADTAIKIAETVWLPLFGESIYDKKPFRVQLKDDKIWVVSGTLKTDEVGGIPYIEIQKSDCKILNVYHTK